jgi:hypothetical protein
MVQGSANPVIVDTTVEELRKLPRPAGMEVLTADPPQFQNKRAGPAEMTIWRITAFVTAIKHEGDGDFHLALQGHAGETMIAESSDPDPKFVGPNNPWLKAMQDVRTAVADQKLHAMLAQVPLSRSSAGDLIPVESFKAVAAAPTTTNASDALKSNLSFKTRIPSRKAQLTGVGFFDRFHDQTGVSTTNVIELHPLLDFKWLE